PIAPTLAVGQRATDRLRGADRVTTHIPHQKRVVPDVSGTTRFHVDSYEIRVNTGFPDYRLPAGADGQRVVRLDCPYPGSPTNYPDPVSYGKRITGQSFQRT